MAKFNMVTLKKKYTDEIFSYMKHIHIIMIQMHLLNTCQLVVFKPLVVFIIT